MSIGILSKPKGNNACLWQTKLAAALMACLVSCGSINKKKENNSDMGNTQILTSEFAGAHGTPQFSKISTGCYMPAFQAALQYAQNELLAIENSCSEPSFSNTIAAIDNMGIELERVSEVFFNLNHAHTNPEMQQIAQEVSPLLANFSSDVYLSSKLFERVASVKEAEQSKLLGKEDAKLLDGTYRAFVQNGALLDAAGKSRLREISARLSQLSLTFSQNVLEETNSYSLHLTNSADIAGLPESVLQAAAELAQERSLEGWVFSLQFPSFFPFMQYADNRELRKQMFMASMYRCNNGNSFDNNAVIQEIISLRIEKSNLLGYPAYSHKVLADRMASSPGNVGRFLEELLQHSLPAAKADKEDVQRYASKHGADFQLERWDWAYYSEKLKEERFGLSDEMTRPYFELAKVEAAIFGLAGKLYGISFEPAPEIELYHPDVKAFKVTGSNGEHLASFYADYFPRESKQGGAWMTSFSSQYIKDGKDHRPCISIVCNFTKPTAASPSLLSFSEVETFLHEFGHALHGIFSKCKYRSLSGTNVYRDFVELPSQIMENWASEPEWLSGFAQHYITGQTMPDDMVAKIAGSKNFQSGYQFLRQISFAVLDMSWHNLAKLPDVPPAVFEAGAISHLSLFPGIEGAAQSTSFSHIFGGGYAAGYYGYKWAEVLDADAYAAFQEAGIFNPEVAKSFRENILEKGGSDHPMELYKAFRGREPEIRFLLERSGLAK
jgi:peptidyl-dipeptidase Dcp